MKQIACLLTVLALILNGCETADPTDNQLNTKDKIAPFFWENANIYFLLTDRFHNGDPSNDVNFDRTQPTSTGRSMMGGDIKGIIQKMQEGYFKKLGVTAIWFTPVLEQNKGSVDEGSGATYAYHGYWAQDWTALDPNFGTEKDLAELVELAHQNGIRILLDVVINHTGPVTEKDPVWPQEWVRTSPKCEYQDYESTVNCTLVENLPDVKTESNTSVELPNSLMEKWKNEGRLENELAELDDFFQRTGYPRAPRFYFMKWLTDYVRKYGIDGYRVDTAKHTEETVWKELRKEADIAFAEWKKNNPDKILDENEFYMVGEVYNYNIISDRDFSFGDKNVDYFENGFTSLINFGFKHDCKSLYDSIFNKYSFKLNGPLKGNSVVNYISSHDDSEPFDKNRSQPFISGTKLLLCPGASQIYYGDETARSLEIEGETGDANLRSFMNWEEINNNTVKNGANLNDILSHWQKLGQFRKSHPAVGAGLHENISNNPYYFKRTFNSGEFKDAVVVGLDLEAGEKEISVENIFKEGDEIMDYYSGKKIKVNNGKLKINTDHSIVLFGK
ncbi:MAG: alpha-amylase family glycosyl hydrolase [Saprospiraceae bacterium]